MYRKQMSGWMKQIDFLVLDILCIIIAYIAAYYLRHPGGNMFTERLYTSTLFVMIVMAVICSITMDTFSGVMKRGYGKEFGKTLYQVIIVELLVTFYLFLVGSGESYSRTTVALTGVIYFVISYITRIAWKKYVARKGLFSMTTKKIVIVTTKELKDRVEQDLIQNNYAGFLVLGVALLDGDAVEGSLAGVPIVATASNLTAFVCRAWVDEIFISAPSTDERTEKVLKEFTEMGITVHLEILHKSGTYNRSQFVERIGNYTVVTTTMNTATTRETIMKRCIDILAGLVGCLITLLLVLVIGPIIYIKSPGPIFFSQTRVGKNGKLFKLYKFRSMYLDAEERKKELMEQNRVAGGMMFKMDHDPRIIGSEKGKNKGVGNFIRRTSIDEWPQFYNILKGEMSLVGTRPPTLDEWEKYQIHHRARLSTKPGLTGMWQVSGRSRVTDFEEVVKLDTKYIMEWSIWLDFKIILKTFGSVFRHDGAM